MSWNEAWRMTPRALLQISILKPEYKGRVRIMPSPSLQMAQASESTALLAPVRTMNSEYLTFWRALKSLLKKNANASRRRVEPRGPLPYVRWYTGLKLVGSPICFLLGATNPALRGLLTWRRIYSVTSSCIMLFSARPSITLTERQREFVEDKMRMCTYVPAGSSSVQGRWRAVSMAPQRSAYRKLCAPLFERR